jgi:hypothetical protein
MIIGLGLGLGRCELSLPKAAQTSAAMPHELSGPKDPVSEQR